MGKVADSSCAAVSHTCASALDERACYDLRVRWFIGDVQGCVRSLEHLVKAIRFDPARDALWLVGDLINRGPESLATLRLWRDLGGRGVIGNHEIYALMAHAGRWPRKEDTLAALFDAPDAETHLATLLALPVLSRVEPSPARRDEGGPAVWAVHAGLDPRWRDLDAIERTLAGATRDLDFLDREEVRFATRVRCCAADGSRSRYHGEPEGCPAPYRPWDDFYEGNLPVVHGHWAWRGHHRTGRVVGLDSGCVYGGPLTAWSPDSDEVVQVPADPADVVTS